MADSNEPSHSADQTTSAKNVQKLDVPMTIPESQVPAPSRPHDHLRIYETIAIEPGARGTFFEVKTGDRRPLYRIKLQTVAAGTPQKRLVAVVEDENEVCQAVIATPQGYACCTCCCSSCNGRITPSKGEKAAAAPFTMAVEHPAGVILGFVHLIHTKYAICSRDMTHLYDIPYDETHRIRKIIPVKPGSQEGTIQKLSSEVNIRFPSADDQPNGLLFVAVALCIFSTVHSRTS